MNGKRTPESTVKRLGAAILRSDGMKKERGFLQHGNVSVYEHSLGVALACVKLARLLRIKVDERSLVRGALLHDYFLYDWHEHDRSHRFHGFIHAARAAKNAERDFGLNKVEKNMIRSHMFPMNLTVPRYRESVILCIADKLCATRETFSTRKKRRGYKKNSIFFDTFGRNFSFPRVLLTIFIFMCII